MSHILIFEIPTVKHCGNCSKSTETGIMDKPLNCSSKAAKERFGEKAGSDDCAKTCKNFQELNHFSTAGLR